MHWLLALPEFHFEHLGSGNQASARPLAPPRLSFLVRPLRKEEAKRLLRPARHTGSGGTGDVLKWVNAPDCLRHVLPADLKPGGDPIDLKQFVSETLTQIVAGIEDAKTKIKAVNESAAVNPYWASGTAQHGATAPVEFDVALVVCDEQESGSTSNTNAAMGKLSVVTAKLATELASQSNGKQHTEMVSRVKFSVQLAQPTDIKRRF
jgi:hypothetical protein